MKTRTRNFDHLETVENIEDVYKKIQKNSKNIRQTFETLNCGCRKALTDVTGN